MALRFLADSAGLKRVDPMAHTAFMAQVAARGIDLTRAPLDVDRALWMAPDDYTATQQIAVTARAADVQVVQYASLRHPEHRPCVALFGPERFA